MQTQDRGEAHVLQVMVGTPIAFEAHGRSIGGVPSQMWCREGNPEMGTRVEVSFCVNPKRSMKKVRAQG